MRAFPVVAGRPATWPGITDAALVVTRFLSNVRVTGAAARPMNDPVLCHQVLAEDPHTVTMTPAQCPARGALPLATGLTLGHLIARRRSAARPTTVQHISNGVRPSSEPATTVQPERRSA